MGDVGGVPGVRSVLTAITLERVFCLRQIIGTCSKCTTATLIGEKSVLLGVFSLLFNFFGISNDG
jgi:hypothetical protein